MTLERLLQEAEARQLPSLIADWSERADVLRWVARALQLDLPLLIERPDVLLPCLYRRCSMLGATFYPGHPRPSDAQELAELIDEWIAARPLRWLRALHPPLLPLDAGVVEEYRTSLEGDVRFSADGSLIGVVGKLMTVCWERSTGRRVDAADRLAAPKQPRWALERAVGRILLRSPTTSWDLPANEGESMFSPVELSDELVLVNCSYDADPYDYESSYAHYLVDVSAGRVLWRVADTCFDAVLAGDAIRARCNGIVLRSVATGQQLATHAIPYSRSIAFAAAGTVVATHSPDSCVLRVWDLATTPSTVPSGRASSGVLSPDGERILAGDALWDARTGALIATIPFTGRGNWLEGGPPAHAWSITSRRVVQVLPFGTRVWDSADGRLLAELDVSAGADCEVVLDPTGRYVAIYRSRRPGSLTVRSLDNAAVLVDTLTDLVTRSSRDHLFGWSQTGDQLWWETEDGEAYVVSTVDWQLRRLPRGAPVPEAPPSVVAITDGLLVLGELAAPMDSRLADVSRDGRIIVGGDHYRLEEP